MVVILYDKVTQSYVYLLYRKFKININGFKDQLSSSMKHTDTHNTRHLRDHSQTLVKIDPEKNYANFTPEN